MAIFYECGICGHYHPWEWDGDCRDNENRYTDDQIPPAAEVRTMEERVEADARALAIYEHVENQPNQTEKDKMTDHPMTIAKTILDQLGGARFTTMTGAKNLTAGRDGLGSLTMKLPPCDFKKKIGGKAITHVRITLTPADVYKVETINVGKSVTTLETADDVYCDMLQDKFLSMTGLITSLGQ